MISLTSVAKGAFLLYGKAGCSGGNSNETDFSTDFLWGKKEYLQGEERKGGSDRAEGACSSLSVLTDGKCPFSFYQEILSGCFHSIGKRRKF